MTAVANSIITPQTPFSRTAITTAAEVAFSAPTAVVDLLLASDNVNGARLTKLVGLPRAANASANNLQLYERVGAVYTLVDSALMGVITPSATVANPKTDFGYSDDNPLYVKAGVGLAVAMGQAIANGVAFKAEGGLY